MSARRGIAAAPGALAFHLRAMRRDADARHRVAARLRAELRRLLWRWRFARLRRRHPGRPLVVVGLVEHLGDLVAAEPIARHLRAAMPGALVVWPVRAPFREIVAHHPAVDEAPTIGCLTEWSWIAGRLGADRVVDLHLEGRSCPRCRIPHRRRDGDRGIDIGNYYHHGPLLHGFARAAALPPLDEAPRLHLPAAARARVDALALPASYVAVHCASNQAARDWTAGRWRELARRIAEELGAPVVEVGLAPVLPPGVRGVVQLPGRLSVTETAEVLRRARLFVGIDSGPAHLAHAAGTPAVILLGRYRAYERYMPYAGGWAASGRADVIQHDGPAAEIPVECVLALVRARLAGATPDAPDARAAGAGAEGRA